MVRLISQKQQLLQPHWEAVCSIMKYLKGASGRYLIFKPNKQLDDIGLQIPIWAGDYMDGRSISGYCTIL